MSRPLGESLVIADTFKATDQTNPFSVLCQLSYRPMKRAGQDLNLQPRE